MPKQILAPTIFVSVSPHLTYFVQHCSDVDDYVADDEDDELDLGQNDDNDENERKFYIKGSERNKRSRMTKSLNDAVVRYYCYLPSLQVSLHSI